MILNDRKAIEQQEFKTLAGFAAKASQSRGRKFPEEEHPLRTAYQRDRDRIVHSTAFRRMEYKTQVFLPHEGDHLRTRLTHTIEVAQIGRTMARCLRLNEDLTEAIALVHDLGHTPYGHAGEDILEELLAEHGGFNHNRQSLRVVDFLEERYPGHPGLNLSYEVREGIVKHETKVRLSHPEFDMKEHPTLEASLVDIADEIAYNGHDIDDGIRAGIITLDGLKELGIWSLAEEHDTPSGGIDLSRADDLARFGLVRRLVNLMVTDVLNETIRKLERFNISEMDALRHTQEKLCGYSLKVGEAVAELKAYLKEKLYLHPSLLARSDQAELTMRTLFKRLNEQTELLPERFKKMLKTECREIVIADYIAGMTDRYAAVLFDKLK